MKMKAIILLMGSLGLGSLAQANENYTYSCKHLKEQRLIEVLYLQRESSLPCEVRYSKGGKQEVLWNANYTKGYCEEKAEEFVKKQEGWGWSCERLKSETAGG